MIDSRLNQSIQQISGTNQSPLEAQFKECGNNTGLSINVNIEYLTNDWQPREESRKPPTRTASQMAKVVKK